MMLTRNNNVVNGPIQALKEELPKSVIKKYNDYKCSAPFRGVSVPLLLLSSISIFLIDHPTPVTLVLWPLKCVPVFSQCHPIRVLHSSLGRRIIINWVESRLPLPCCGGLRLLKLRALRKAKNK